MRFRAEVETTTDLGKLSATLLDLFRSNGYRDTFGWIDNIRLVEEDLLVEHLRDQLVADLLANPVPPTIDAILPDDLLPPDDDRAIRYILFPRERMQNASRVNLTVDTLSRFVSSTLHRGAPGGVLDSQLRFLDDDMEQIGRAKLAECVCADFLLDGYQYMAYDGDFYLVDRSFVQRIDEELAQLRRGVKVRRSGPSEAERQVVRSQPPLPPGGEQL